MALTIAAGVGVCVCLVMGIVADRLAAKPLMVVALAVESTALFTLPWASTLVTFGILAGIESGMSRGAAVARQTILARTFTGPERTTARARMRVVTNLGIGLGSGAAALVLLDPSPAAFRFAMMAAASTYLAAALLALHMPLNQVDATPPSRATAEPPRRQPWRDRRYLALTCTNGATATHFAIIEVGLPIWLVTQTEAPTVLVGLLLLLNTTLVVLLQVRLNRGFEHPDRAGRGFVRGGMLLAAATLAYAAATLGGPLTASAALVAGALAHGMGEILTAGAGFSLSFELADSSAPGAYQGFYGTGQSLGMMAGPALATLVIAFGPGGWLLYTVGFASLGLIGRSLTRHPPPPHPPASEHAD